MKQQYCWYDSFLYCYYVYLYGIHHPNVPIHIIFVEIQFLEFLDEFRYEGMGILDLDAARFMQVVSWYVLLCITLLFLKSTLISYVLFVVPWSPYCYICGNYYLGYLPSWLTSWFLDNYMKLWLCISLQNNLYSHTFLCLGCKPS